MSDLHVVEQGEHAASIALGHGFQSFDPIWDHPENEALRKKRKDPNVLLPGDRLYIPDATPKQVRVPTGKRHMLVVQSVPTKLRLRLLDFIGDPLASATGTLEVDGAAQKVTTDGEGFLEVTIPSTVATALLTMLDLEYALSIGHLDPEDTPTGVDGRLVNLGYRFVEPDALALEHNRPALHFATELFSHDQQIRTEQEKACSFLERLRQAHGC